MTAIDWRRMTRGTESMKKIPLHWIALVVAAFVCWVAIKTPEPVLESSDAAGFSAARALKDVRILGKKPHPVGSEANREVREYLIERMTSLALSPRVQEATSFEVSVGALGSVASGGLVSNVIGVLPGRDPSAPVLALMAHYDSAPGSPGSADDAAGVSSALEIIRAIRAKGIPDRDVAVVLTDGEEAGLLGARAFFESDPLASRIGYVINMETRGGGGRTAMFETAARNGGDIDVFRRTAQMPDSNSLAVFVYEHLPNDTDFSIVKQHGKRGLNYAFIDRQFDYHSPSSTPDALELGSLQHMGTEVLPTAIALAFGPLPSRADDVVYGDIFGLFVISYAPWIGWLLLLGIAGTLLAVVIRNRQAGRLALPELATSIGAGIYLVMLSGAALECGRRLTGVGSGWIEYRPLLAHFTVFEVMMGLWGLSALLIAITFALHGRSRLLAGGLVFVVGVASSLANGSGIDSIGMVFGGVGCLIAFATFGSANRVPVLWIGLVIVQLFAATGLQVFAPTVAFIVTWPLVVAALAASLTLAWERGRILALGAAAAASSMALAWLGLLFHSLLQSLDVPALALLPVWLAAPIIVCLKAQNARVGAITFAPAAALWVIGLCLSLLLRFTDPWTQRHPAPAEPVFVVDPMAGKAWFASLLKPDPWVESVLTSAGGSLTTLSLPLISNPVAASLSLNSKPVTAASAEPVAVEGAKSVLELLEDGRFRLTVEQPAGAARVVVSFSCASRIDDITINGQPTHYVSKQGVEATFAVNPHDLSRVIWAAPSGFSMSFRTSDPETVKVTTAEIYDRWMAKTPLPAMPPSDEPWDIAGATVVLGSVSVLHR